MKAAVLFDMDGVLIDSYRPHWLSWQATCQARGVTMTEEQYIQLFGSSFRSFVQVLAPHLDDAAIDQWYSDKERMYRNLIRETFPEMPGASALIRDLKKAGFLVGVASSGPRDNVNTLLQLLPAGSLIDDSCSSNEVKRGKPFPDVFEACALLLGVMPSQCVVVEDSLHGLQAARTAGMAAVALTGTCTREQLLPHAACVVEQLPELSPDHFLSLLTDPQERKVPCNEDY